MALTAATALNKRATHSFSITVATALLKTYAAADGTPTTVTADGSAADNTVEIVRDVTGDIYGIRGNAGVVISKKKLRSARAVFKFLFEGVGTAGTTVGSYEA